MLDKNIYGNNSQKGLNNIKIEPFRRYSSHFFKNENLNLLSPKKSTESSSQKSFNTNINNKINLQTNSLFAFQENDQFSNIFANQSKGDSYLLSTKLNNDDTNTQINFSQNDQSSINKEEMNNSFSSSVSKTSSDKEESMNANNNLFFTTNKKKNKRFSDGYVFLQKFHSLQKNQDLFNNLNNNNFYPNNNINIANNNNNNNLNIHNNNINLNNNNMTPNVSLFQSQPQNIINNNFNSSISNKNNINNFRRNSLESGLVNQFNFMNIQQKKIMSFIQNQNSQINANSNNNNNLGNFPYGYPYQQFNNNNNKYPFQNTNNNPINLKYSKSNRDLQNLSGAINNIPINNTFCSPKTPTENDINNLNFTNYMNNNNPNDFTNNFLVNNNNNNNNLNIMNMNALNNINNMNNVNNINIMNNMNNNITNLKNSSKEDQFILENLSTLLQDQAKCRQIQNKLEEKKNNEEFVNLFFDLIEPNLVDIINHQFGNYVIQKYFDVIIYQNNKNLITQFFSAISGDLFKISVNNYGTRVFQKALEKLDNGVYSQVESNTLNKIIQNLIEKHIFALCYDKNGNHVFQKIVRIFPKNKNQFIYDQLNQYSTEISKLKQGVSILETSLKFANENQKNFLLNKILEEIPSLINDEYGNYIIQFIVQLKEKEFNDIIYHYITKNVLNLSKKKFSSNVIDKCIISDDENSFKLVQYLIDNKLIREMIVDQFGNYVIQKALNTTNGYIFMSIIHQIKPALDTLKRSNIGRKIYEHLMRKYGDYFSKDVEETNFNKEGNFQDKNSNNKTIIIPK